MEGEGTAGAPQPTRRPGDAVVFPTPLESRQVEEFLRFLPDAMVVVDASGTIAFANPLGERLFGYGPGQLRGRPVEDLVPARFRGRHAEHRADFFTSPATRPMGERSTLVAIRRDGTEFPVEISLGPLDTELGIVAVAAIRGVAERTRVNEALHQAPGGFLQMFQSSPVAMAVLGLQDGRFMDVNPAYEELLGWPRGDVIGRTSVELGLNADSALRKATYANVSEGRPVRNVEATVTNRRGDQITVLGGAQRLRLGDQDCLLVSLVDITGRKRLEDDRQTIGFALEKHVAQLAESNRELERFAYVASHDLQDPLRVISNYSGLLTQKFGDSLGENGRRWLQYLAASSSRLSEMIDDLLEYSSLRRTDHRKDRVDMAALAAECKAVLKEPLKAAGGDISWEDLPVIVGDRHQLRQLLQNLFGNAIKFRRADTHPQIRLHAEKNPEGWLFQVSDNGIGIEPQYRERIFQIFQRLHTRDQYPGTGIGLAVCKRVVQNHGGNIWVESTVGTGSTFFFTIPTNPPPG